MAGEIAAHAGEIALPNRIPAFGFNQLVLTGPNPFESSASANGSSIGNSTLLVPKGTMAVELLVTDDDLFLEDGDSSQRLAAPTTINGQSYAVNQSVETEYSYVIRPQGSTDPAEWITIQVLEFGSSVQAITADGWLQQGVVYEFVSANNDPVVPYSSIALCLTAGMRVITSAGPVCAGSLRPDMRVQTLDNGLQPLRWVLRQRRSGTGAAAPFRIGRGVLGNGRALWLSAQHRVLVGPAQGLPTETLVPVKGLAHLPGISQRPCAEIVYVHLLCDRHEIVLAEGAAVETLLPGPMAKRAVREADPGALLAMTGCSAVPARALLRPGQVARFSS